MIHIYKSSDAEGKEADNRTRIYEIFLCVLQVQISLEKSHLFDVLASTEMVQQMYEYIRPSEWPEDAELTRWDIWRGRRENTTVHGIPNLTRAQGTRKF